MYRLCQTRATRSKEEKSKRGEDNNNNKLKVANRCTKWIRSTWLGKYSRENARYFLIFHPTQISLEYFPVYRRITCVNNQASLSRKMFRVIRKVCRKYALVKDERNR